MPAPSRDAGSACTVGLWGTFDLENYGDQLFPLIAGRELARRLGDVELRHYSPFGWARAARLDRGDPAEPFGPREPSRLDELAAQLDAVLVGGGEIIHFDHDALARVYDVEAEEVERREPASYFVDGLGPARERECPVLWHAVGLPFDLQPDEATRVRHALASRPYVTVRDSISRGRLEAAGVDREITVVPDSAVLLPRLFPPEVLSRRLRYLRLMGWYPSGERVLVVQGNRDLVRFAPDIAVAVDRLTAEDSSLTVALVDTGPCHGDAEFAEALAPRLRVRPHRLPTELTVEDIAAVIADGVGFIGISLHGSITAFAYDRPFVVLNLNDQSKLDGFAAQVDRPEVAVHQAGDLFRVATSALTTPVGPSARARLQRGADAHFDRISEIVVAARAARPRERSMAADAPCPSPRARRYDELAALRRAHESRGRRMVCERQAMAEQVLELKAELDAARQRLAELEREVDAQQRVVDEAGAWAHELAAAHESAAGELERLRATKTFRWTASARGAYGWLRRQRSR